MADVNNPKIGLKLSTNRSIKTSTSNRRSQRRRTNIQPPMRTSSLTTTIFRENSYETAADSDNVSQIEENFEAASPDQLLFTTTSKINSKSSYWTVTDRQAEWYKLSILVNLPTTDQTKQIVPYQKLFEQFERRKSTSHNNDQIDQPSDTTQLIMKPVMHELDYDMDDDDMKFLHEINQTQQKRRITEEEFENAMIILEFSTAEKICSHLKQRCCEDEAIVCDVCLLPDGDDGNEMVFCERCNCCVHQNCYGISVVPSGTWLCRPCSILRRPACILCPKLGGPMKCTASGTIWCHVTCALWLPELKFVDHFKMEPVLHMDRISHARWSLRCVVCSTSEGACVQCAHKNCRTPFHVTCGLASGYFLDVQQITSTDPSTSRSQFNAYCFKHSEEARKNSEPDLLTTLSNENNCSLPLTVYRRNQLKTEQWINDSYKNFTTFISSDHLHEECPDSYNEKISKKIYHYWKNKREINNAMPLIKRIDFVLEQRENAELLITQINTCLKTRQKLIQLQTRCQSVLESSTTLTQRLDSLKKAFSSSISPRNHHHRRRRRLPSISPSLHGKNDHDNENKTAKFKRYCRKRFSSSQTIEKAKRCRVSLESTYRHKLQLNTTYLIGQTNEGQMFLLPKQFVEQTNIITRTDNNIFQQPNVLPSTDYSDMSDDDNESTRQKQLSQPTQIAYTSHRNVVTCTTGSFN